MKTTSSKLLLILTGGMFGASLTLPQSVQAMAITWDLSFYNQNNQQIGRGFFSYDDGLDAWDEVNNFSANIQGTTFNNSQGNGEIFWESPSSNNYTDSSGGAHSILYNRYGQSYRLNSWSFGDVVFLETPALVMLSSSQSPLFNLIPQGGGNVISGSWSAVKRNTNTNAVPEGGTFLGVLTGIGMLSIFKKVK